MPWSFYSVNPGGHHEPPVGPAPFVGATAGEPTGGGFRAEVAQPLPRFPTDDGNAPIVVAAYLETTVVEILLVFGPGDAIMGRSHLPNTDVEPFVFLKCSLPFPP